METAGERSSNKSTGWNAGVAASYGSNGMAWGITAGGNYGKGHGNSNSTTHRHSQIGDAGSQTTLQSGGKTTIKGAQVLGKGVALDTQDLDIHSVQDTATYESKQKNIQGQVTVGYGASASGSFSKSNISADYAGVSKQSGILAGEDGFNVRVKGHTDLKGGLIAAAQSAEAAGKNQFSTGTLSHSDIENHSQYKGKSFGLSGGVSISGESLGQGEYNPNGGLQKVAGQNGFNKSIGYGKDGDSQSSVTRSGIGTKTIRIGDDGSGEQAKAVYTDTTTENAAARSGSLENNFDAGKVQSELDLQRSVSQAFDSNRQAAKAEINKNRDDLEQQRKAGTITEAEYQDKAKNLDNLALLLDTVSAGLYTPSNSVGGSLTAAASPAMTQKIGEIFKPGGAMAQYEGTALHGAAQGIWAAAVAYAGGNDPLSVGISAGASEVAVPVLGNWLFPDKDKADYTAEEKQTLSAIAGVLSAGGTLAAGGSATDAAAANVAATNAVENNGLFKAIISSVKIGKKIKDIYNKKNKITWGDIKQAAKDEGLDIADSILTLTDGELTPDDARALIDLIVGTELNTANKGAAARKLEAMAKKYNNNAIQNIKNKYLKADGNTNAKVILGREHNATVLSANLEKAGVPRPSGTQAHHIVGKTTPDGQRTQALLKKLGIDVNSPTNGVFLPGCNQSNAIGMVHCGKHTQAYEQAIWNRLQSSQSKQDAINRLQKIRNELLDNTFTPLNKRSI